MLMRKVVPRGAFGLAPPGSGLVADVCGQPPEALSRGHNPACLTSDRGVAPVSARIAAAPTAVSRRQST
jgi:hypothetical protein